MSIDKNDPRLTAYALGEMDPGERTAFEKELARDPAARAEVAAIGSIAGRVEQELARESAPALYAAQRSVIERAGGVRRRGWIVPVSALAACVLVAIGLSAALIPMDRKMAERVEEMAKARADAERSGRLYQEGASTKELVGKESSEPAAAGPPKAAKRPEPKARPNAHGKRAGRRAQKAPQAQTALAPRERRPAAVTAIPGEPPNTESYDRIVSNNFKRVDDEDVSTFSVDVDTASYANVRRFLTQGKLPPKDAVRIEELINYFRYDYAAPAADSEHPFRANVEVAGCPWNAKHRLARIGIKGKTMHVKDRPPTNLVFLVDVSGSMRPENKLPLLKQSLRMLVDELDEGDRVAIAVYAGAAGLVLPSTPCNEKETIHAALARLQSGGSTNGGAGIQLAYRIAAEHFIKDGVNRVILATDGDFNVGVSDTGSLTRLVEEKAKAGVFLTILGFGRGNYKDSRMEQLSNRGNGNYAYIDKVDEARKVLVDGLGGTLIAIAKDVKIQVFFNPKEVAGYRLIGYENRLLQKEDFNDDTKDAGDIGAGHTVTALYEIVPAGQEVPGSNVDPNPFVSKRKPSDLADSKTLLQLKLRYKQPDGDESTLMEKWVMDRGAGFDAASRDFRWAATVAAFGMLLRGSEHAGGASWDFVLEAARGVAGDDTYRREFVDLVKRATGLVPKPELEVAGSRVQNVRDNLVVISIGSLDGVRVGDTFHIRRDRTYVGQIRIDKVEERMSVGVFDNEFSGDAAPPRPGDTVYREK